MSKAISKLPKWAQEQISILEEEAKYWKDKYQSFSSGEGPVVLNPYDETEVRLPKETIVRFEYKSSNGFVPEQGHIDVKVKEDHIELVAIDALLVENRASNCLDVWSINAKVDSEIARRKRIKDRANGAK